MESEHEEVKLILFFFLKKVLKIEVHLNSGHSLRCI